MRVLIVEDEEPLLEQLRARLKQEGYTVDSAADGEEGQYLATELPCDAAIIDLGLAKLSGIELIRKARAAGKTFPNLILTVRGRWQERWRG
jgi:two-component system response regulator PhoP